MMKKVLFIISFVCASGTAFGQISSLPAAESFDAVFVEGTPSTFIPNWTGNVVAPPSSRIFRDEVDFNSAPAAMSIIPTSSFNGDIQVSLNLTSYQSVAVSFLAKSMLNGAGTRDAVLTMSTSIDGGITWLGSVPVASLPNANQTAFTTYTYALPIEANNQASVLVRFLITRGAAGTSTAAKMVIDDVAIQQVSTPQLAVSQSSLAFSQVLGVPSQSQYFNIIGSNLTSDVTVTAPVNYEISLASGSGFTTSLNLIPTFGTLLSTPIYVRLNSSVAGSTAGTLTVTSFEATTQNVALTGDTSVSIVTDPLPLDLFEGSDTSVFSAWDGASVAGTYPANMVFWTHATADPDLNTLFIEDWTCLYNLTTRSRFNGEGDNGVSFINTGNSQFTGVCDGTDPTQATGTTVTNGRAGAIVMAFNTTAVTSASVITVNWTGRTILKNLRAYGLRMQYRVGNGGGNGNVGWLEFPETVEYLSGEDATSEVKTCFLPFECNGQALVEVRWVYYYISGTGARAQLALDDVTVSVTSLGTPSFAVANDFTLYPNPSNKGIVTLSSAQDLTVYDMVGHLVLTKNGATTIDTAGLAAGIYLVKTANHITKKLVIE